MKRFLDWTPKELAKMDRQSFLDSIRASECRVVGAYVCPKSMNYVEKVSNIETVASFGADFITLEGYDPKNLQMPGLPSKDITKDSPYKELLQADMGFGWTIQELKELVGRPIGTNLMITLTEDEDLGYLYEKNVCSKEMIEYIISQKYDFIALGAIRTDESAMKVVLEALKQAKEIAGDRIVIGYGIPHGSFTVDAPYNLREVVTPEIVSEIIKTGVDIIELPAVGVIPGFTQEYVSKLVDIIHNGNVLASCNIAHSIEGSDSYTVKHVVLENKPCGFDILNVAAGGIFESIPLPEVLMDICITTKGKRHTYRRMCQSPKR